MNNFELTDMQQACLLIIRSGDIHIGNLHKNWNTPINSLLDLNLIQWKPNMPDELMLTITGEDCLMKGVMIKYPLYNGNIGGYNDVIRTMTPEAINALICAMMSERAFEKVPKITARVLGQHLLDVKMWKLWGSVLIGKYLRQCKSSMEHFSSYGKNNNTRNKYKHKS